jgi:hypothetical protein
LQFLLWRFSILQLLLSSPHRFPFWNLFVFFTKQRVQDLWQERWISYSTQTNISDMQENLGLCGYMTSMVHITCMKSFSNFENISLTRTIVTATSYFSKLLDESRNLWSYISSFHL